MRTFVAKKTPIIPRRICVVGLWHQATVLAACFSQMGHWVTVVGDDPAAIANLSHAKSPVVEPRLDAMLRRSIELKNLSFTPNFEQGLPNAEFVFLSIDTPVNDADEPQLASIFDAARKLARYWNPDAILCVTSQVPVGTCQILAAQVTEASSAMPCEVAYIPEFLRLGDAVNTFFHADRFVIGAETAEVAERVAQIYLPLGRPVLRMALRSAEMAKHASNCFLATSISFINEVSDLCDRVGADALDVARAMKLDHRIGAQAFLSPGLGFAGGTLGRDLCAIEELARRHGCAAHLPGAVLAINKSRLELVKRRLQNHYETLRGLRVGVLGITYKAGTSTLRRSMAIEIMEDLVREGVEVRAYDPLANWAELRPQRGFARAPDAYSLAEGCDALVLVTEWQGILDLDLYRLRSAMRRPVFLDTRNLFNPQEMSRAGFLYSGLGRGHSAGIVAVREFGVDKIMEDQAR